MGIYSSPILENRNTEATTDNRYNQVSSKGGNLKDKVERQKESNMLDLGLEGNKSIIDSKAIAGFTESGSLEDKYRGYTLRQAIDEEFDDILNSRIVTEDAELAKAIKAVMESKIYKRWHESKVDEGLFESAINKLLLEAAKKAKKKKKKEKEDDDKDTKDDDSSTDDDDLDIGDDDDSSDDKKDKDSKKSKKKSSKKDKDDDDGESKSDDKDEVDDDKSDDDKKSVKDKKKDSKKKSSKKKEDKDDDDDLDLDESTVFSSKSVVNMDRALLEEFYSVLDVQLQPKMKIPQKRGFLEATRLKLNRDYEFPVKGPEFRRAVREFCDTSDNNTRVIMVSVDEDDQSVVLHSLTDKLYDIIVDKAATIDYGPIPQSKGDIRALQNYEKIEDCLDTIRQILVQYKQDCAPVDEVKEAIENVAERKEIFVRGFNTSSQFVVFTYNTIVLAIVASTSLLISASIEFIKNPNSDEFKMSLDKVGYSKAKNALLLDNVRNFNIACKDKSLDNAMNSIIRSKGKHFLGTSTMAAIGAAGVVAVILFNILPILRELTYFFYYTRTRISDYFNLQADLLEISSENIRNGDSDTVGKKDVVIKRQQAIAERFRKIADFFMIDNKHAEYKAESDIRSSAKKLKADDFMEDVPDSTKSALF